MKYILSPEIALRAFRGVEHCYYHRGQVRAYPLTDDDFKRLLLCDGTRDLPEDEITALLLRRKLILPCPGDNARLSSWQQYRFCDNRYVPYLYLQITGKCNYNCIHCFNAKDNQALNTEMSFPQIISLLDQARDCGMNAVSLTGGEPLCHPDFLRIVEAIYERDMFLFELITNGSLLTEKILDRFDSLGAHPTVKISFDGLGYHDTMRCHAGAEEEALQAIRLLIARGYSVQVQCNINRCNADCIPETLAFLDGLGVESTRIIRTSETPRIEHRQDIFLSFDEYYETASNIIKDYASGSHRMRVSVWLFCEYDPAARSVRYIREGQPYRDTLPLCTEARGRLTVSADGSLYPCLQCSGVFLRDHVDLGNAFTTPLHEILGDSPFMRFNDRRVGERLEQKENEKCRKCEYWTRCVGGCPLLGYGFSEKKNWLAADPMICRMFRGKYDRQDLIQ